MSLKVNKFYSENQIYTATFLGGPISAGILIYQNLKRIGDQRKASGTLLFTLVFTFLLFLGIMHLPDAVVDKIPNIAFTSLYTVIVYVIYNRYMADRFNAELQEADSKASGWKVAGFTFMGLVINLVIIFSIAVAQPPFPGQKMTFGSLKHEVYFDKDQLDPSTVESVAFVLAETQFFGFDYQMAIKLEVEEDLLIVAMDVQKEYWTDGDLLIELESLKEALHAYLKQDVKIEMIHYSLNNLEERQRI